MGQAPTNREGYLLGQAVRDVFGADRAWASWLVVVVTGVLGAAVAPIVNGSAEASGDWGIRCTGGAVGIVIGGLLTLLPQMVGVVRLGAALRSRPADAGSVDRPWWPLRLLTAALADTPPARRTAQDVTEAVAGLVPLIRGLLGRRSWPACAAAFVAPVLGLVAAWFAWAAFIDSQQFQDIMRAAQQKQETLRVPGVGVQAALPMIVSIAAALLLMLAVVGIDQWSRRLIQGWATALQPADAEAAFVKHRLGDGIAPRVSGAVITGGPAGPVTRPEPRDPGAATGQGGGVPREPPDLEGLGRLFGQG